MKTVTRTIAVGTVVLGFASGAAAQETSTFTDALGRSLLIQEPVDHPLFGADTIPTSIETDPLTVTTDPGVATTPTQAQPSVIAQPPVGTRSISTADTTFGTGDTTTPGDTVFPSLMSPTTVSGTDTAGFGTTTGGAFAATSDSTGPVTVRAEDPTDPDAPLIERPVSNPELALLSAPDQAWIAISGTVRFTAEDSFVLDYEDGSVRVRMENWEWYNDSSRLALANDQVRVYAPVTGELFNNQQTSAWSIFIESFATYYHASDMDARDPAFRPIEPVVPSSVELKGTVTEVSGDTFVVGTGDVAITVDVSGLGDNPLDEEGYLRVSPNDLVVVNAPLDSNFFVQRWLQANFVAVMRRDPTRQLSDGIPR